MFIINPYIFSSGYTITNALMLDGAADSLTKTFSGSGNRNTYTRSFWIKRNKLGAQQKIFDTGPDGGNNLENLYFNSDDTLQWVINDSNATKYNYATAQVFRDTTAWYHFVVARNTATVKMYVNGDEITNFATTPTNTGASNVGRWTHTDQNVIGKYFLSASDFLGGYLAEIIQVDGSILTPSSFGEENDEGVWVPIEPPASLGTNGFHLDFESTDIGNDAAGSNNWTAVVGTSNVASDSPTDKSSSEVTIYQAWETATSDQAGSWGTPSQELSNTKGGSSSGASYNLGTMSLTSGKWYWRVQITQESSGYPAIGVHKTTATPAYDGGYIAGDTNGWCILTEGTHNGKPRHNGTNGSALHTYSNGDYVDVALDMDNGKIWFGRNGTFDGNPAAGSGEAYSSISGSLVPSMSTSTSSYGIIDTSGGTPPTGFSQYTRTATSVGNYATLNSLAVSPGTLSNGNLSTSLANYNSFAIGTIPMPSGKWYWEAQRNDSGTQVVLGIADPRITYGTDPWSSAYIWAMKDDNNGDLRHNNTNYGSGAGWNGTVYSNAYDVVSVAYDADNAALYFAVNGTWVNGTHSSASVPTSGSSKTGAFTTNLVSGNAYIPFFGSQVNATRGWDVNFGQKGFTYTPPTGFKALNTANFPTPTVTKPSDYFKAITYEGNGSTLAKTGVGFRPDFVWIKCRDVATNWNVYDVVRGDDAMLRMASNPTNTEQTGSNHEFDSFGDDGFTVTHSGAIEEVNRSGADYVAYCMKAGGSPSDNNTGSVTSSVSAADHGGFSVGTFTAGANGAITVGHGLTRAIGMLILKDRESSGGYFVWSDQLTNTAHYLRLENVSGTYTDGGTNVWNGVNPGASSPSTGVFSTKDNGDWLTNGNSHVFYAFARTPGLIAMGSFEGASAADGSHIIVDDGAAGFKPAFFMFKKIDANGDWYTFDSARNTYNPVNNLVSINQTKNESTMASDSSSGTVDFTANGVKFRSTNSSDFQGSNTFIYLAFAETPFGGDSVAQARAR